MRVISATRNVRIIGDRAVVTVEVAVSAEDHRESSIATATQLAADAAMEVAGEDIIYVPSDDAIQFVTVSKDAIAFVWVTPRKP